jgi:hypothetical protein
LLCENLCEKNFPKSAKIGKNRKNCGKSYQTNSAAYNDLRRLGNPEALSSNPQIARSNRAPAGRDFTSDFRKITVFNGRTRKI